ncbi:hypothetical protein HDU87_006320 [Geranomyces variabilis]|uniref:HECT-type E3 ubiquitin transferase n=1 Tax=Geranomyces variabilis TaxID=109894 RepID=A0AAD5TFI2_9FUNG|nr:hypothetical protein HDU87_006320 [Geranomyces variabilis]
MAGAGFIGGSQSVLPADSSPPQGLPRSTSFQAALNDPSLSSSLQDAAPKRSYTHPNSPANSSRIKFEKAVRRYYHQLLTGCGDETCSHKLCASSKLGPRLSPDAAAIMAVQLASRPRHFFCPRIPLEPEAAMPSHLPVNSLSALWSGSTPPASPNAPRQARMEQSNAQPNTKPLCALARGGHLGNVNARTFLSSLLSASPFARVFNTSTSDASTMRRAHSTSDVDDVHHDNHIQENAKPKIDAATLVSVSTPAEQTLSKGLRPFEEGGMLGLKLLTKLGHEPPDTLSARSRSSTDLPSLMAACGSFPKHAAIPGIVPDPPSQPLSRAASRSSLLEQDSGSENLPNPRAMSLENASSAAHAVNEEPQLSLRYLTLPLLKSTLATYSISGQTGDTKFLANSLRTVFSDSDALNRSFLDDGDASKPRHPSGLDLGAVREAYALIATLPKDTFLRPLANAIEILLARLRLNATKLQTAPTEKWRQLLILLENPLLRDRSYHDSLLSKMCQVIGSMRAKTRTLFINWLAQYDSVAFHNLVDMFQSYVVDHFQHNPQPDDAIVAAVKTLALLYKANEAAQPAPHVEISVFYNDELHRKLNFKEQYRIWKRTLENGAANVTEFSYFNYPFLFDPVAKTRIMHIDAMVQMSLEFEDAFVHQALVVHAQKFLQDSPSVTQLEEDLKGRSNPFLVLEIRRDRLVADVLDQLRQKGADLKKPLKVRFVGGGEEGMDQGGVQKEFFQVIMNMLLDPSYGMFTYDEDTRYSWINGASLESEQEFELVGSIVGLALYNGVILDVHFPRVMYKRLLDEAPNLEDIKEGWPALGKGLQQLLDWTDGDVGDVFVRTFEISYEVYGIVKNFPLVDGGEDLIVTNQDREKYVDLYIHHFVVESTRRQFTAFRRGFHKICGGRALKMCRPSELELLLCGVATDDLDFCELEAGAGYDDGYEPGHPVIVWFWHIVHSMDVDHKKKLLNFVTASDRVPLNGLGGLTFVVQRNGPDTNRLPTSLTCFGRLLLPEYATKEKLEDRLITAIENAKGFGLV